MRSFGRPSLSGPKHTSQRPSSTSSPASVVRHTFQADLRDRVRAPLEKRIVVKG